MVNVIFKLIDMTMDEVGNINMGGRLIDNASVMQAETMSVGTAESNVVMQWDGDCLSMNATEGMVRMSGLADPKDGCDAATKAYVDSILDIAREGRTYEDIATTEYVDNAVAESYASMKEYVDDAVRRIMSLIRGRGGEVII